ncbi:hypothetical protein PTI45_04469 [Paenibacillus nuruki]|uniref:Uncharacterized protein n=1 Tax=Paenibacillus nuruki TaxID=1886670 RepID=A0A1E3KY00_9BACL|nr:hypothetical protein [Paenibacillus nuruki]ODP26191.1 hypothetical protein PTI45_04469 [Paenibacillus nuruki]
MHTWMRDNYKIIPIEHHHGLYKFEVVQNNEVIAVISPATLIQQKQVITALDEGEDIHGWDDCTGNTIYVY